MKKAFIFLLIVLLGLTAHSQSAYFFGTMGRGAAYDVDAQAYFTAAGITDGTQKNAWNTAVLSLKANSFWTRIKAVYPFLGGSATTHKYNAKDPRDLDAAYRLTFGGVITHNSSGADPDGSSAEGDTHLIPSVAFSDNLITVGVYITEAPSAADVTDIGTIDGSFVECGMQTRVSGNLFYPLIGSGGFPNASNSTGGFFCSNRLDDFTIEGYKNGSKIVSGSQSGARTTTNSITLFARHTGSSAYDKFSDRKMVFAIIATSFSESEMATLNTIIETYEDALSRGIQ